MFLMTTENFEYAFVTFVSFYLISILVRQDLQDRNEPSREETIEESEPAVEVLDIERMTPSEKVQVMTARIDKMEKLLLSENKLNNIHRCLVDAQQLKGATDNPYQTERAVLGRAITWLEKPLVTRGQFDVESVPSRRDEEEMCSRIESLMRTMWRATNPDQTLSPGEDHEPFDPSPVTEDHDDVEDDDGNDLQEPSAREVITLENVLELGRWLRLQAAIWSPGLFRCASDTVKVWFVVFMTVRFAVLNPRRSGNATNVFRGLSEKYWKVQARVDEENDETTMVFRLFPMDATPVAENRTGGFYGYLNRLLVRVKSVFRRRVPTDPIGS